MSTMSIIGGPNSRSNISNCRSKELRRKILEKVQTFSFKLCKNWHGIMKWSRGKQKEHVYPLGQSIESLTACPGRTVEIPVHRQVVSVTDVEERFILPKMSDQYPETCIKCSQVKHFADDHRFNCKCDWSSLVVTTEETSYQLCLKAKDKIVVGEPTKQSFVRDTRFPQLMK